MADAWPVTSGHGAAPYPDDGAGKAATKAAKAPKDEAPLKAEPAPIVEPSPK